MFLTFFFFGYEFLELSFYFFKVLACVGYFMGDYCLGVFFAQFFVSSSAFSF